MAINSTLDRPIDRQVYTEELAPWLPPEIIDVHVHVRLPEHRDPINPERFKEAWALEVGGAQSWEELRDRYNTLFPKQTVSVLAFGGVSRETHIAENNEYVLEGTLDPKNRAHALWAMRPEWDPSVIENAVERGFLGIKPYPELAPQHTTEVSIYDFVPHSHLAVLNRLGAILMIHIGRNGRLGDPNNIRELLEISDKYPSIKLIVAHIGRAYCLPTAEKGLPHFADRPGVYFDTSANLNPDVFELAMEIIGSDRLLYGTDLPAMKMRGVREYVGEEYFNFTDGNYSWNTNRKSPEEEARYTYYVYEEIRALIEAAKRVGFGKAEMEKIFFTNSANLLGMLASTGSRR